MVDLPISMTTAIYAMSSTSTAKKVQLIPLENGFRIGLDSSTDYQITGDVIALGF